MGEARRGAGGVGGGRGGEGEVKPPPTSTAVSPLDNLSINVYSVCYAAVYLARYRSRFCWVYSCVCFFCLFVCLFFCSPLLAHCYAGGGAAGSLSAVTTHTLLPSAVTNTSTRPLTWIFYFVFVFYIASSETKIVVPAPDAAISTVCLCVVLKRAGCIYYPRVRRRRSYRPSG